MTIAIDFGTSNTVISRWNQTTKQPEIVKLPDISIISVENPPLIPSLIYVENIAEKKVVIGQQVRDKGYDVNTESRFFRNFKRGIGANGSCLVTQMRRLRRPQSQLPCAFVQLSRT